MQDCDTLVLRKTTSSVTLTTQSKQGFGKNPYTAEALLYFTTNTAIHEKDTDVEDSHDEMWNDSDVRSLPGLRLGGGPVQGIQNVLAEGGEETVCHLRE